MNYETWIILQDAHKNKNQVCSFHAKGLNEDILMNKYKIR